MRAGVHPSSPACLLALVLSVWLPVAALAAEPVRILTLDWTSQVVVSHIFGRLMERIGQPVAYVAQEADAQWFLVSSGQVDLQVEVWEGTMAAKFHELTRRGLIVDAGTHAALTREEWWYPDYVEPLCPGLPDWRALKACASLFDMDGSGRGVYYTGPWEKPDAARIRALDLPFAVVKLDDATALRRLLEESVAHQRPVVLFNWTPNWVESLHCGQFVEFPEYAPACETDPGWGINPHLTWDCGNPKDGWLKKIVSREFPAKWPCAYALVRAISMTNLDIAEAASLVEVGGHDPATAAQWWLDANRETWQAWLQAAGCVAEQTPEGAP